MHLYTNTLVQCTVSFVDQNILCKVLLKKQLCQADKPHMLKKKKKLLSAFKLIKSQMVKQKKKKFLFQLMKAEIRCSKRIHMLNSFILER